jgi:kojibiose phosphorylase
VNQVKHPEKIAVGIENTEKSTTLQAVIFDLDGVITDTAEFHYLAWKKLADEEGLLFDRSINEKLRGVSRRESLLIILNGRSLSQEALTEMMLRKNTYYQQMLHQISPADLLPGVENLLDELDAADIPYAIASASRNAPFVALVGITAVQSSLAHVETISK